MDEKKSMNTSNKPAKPAIRCQHIQVYDSNNPNFAPWEVVKTEISSGGSSFKPKEGMTTYKRINDLLGNQPPLDIFKSLKEVKEAFAAFQGINVADVDDAKGSEKIMPAES